MLSPLCGGLHCLSRNFCFPDAVPEAAPTTSAALLPTLFAQSIILNVKMHFNEFKAGNSPYVFAGGAPLCPWRKQQQAQVR